MIVLKVIGSIIVVIILAMALIGPMYLAAVAMEKHNQESEEWKKRLIEKNENPPLPASQGGHNATEGEGGENEKII